MQHGSCVFHGSCKPKAFLCGREPRGSCGYVGSRSPCGISMHRSLLCLVGPFYTVHRCVSYVQHTPWTAVSRGSSLHYTPRTAVSRGSSIHYTPRTAVSRGSSIHYTPWTAVFHGSSIHYTPCIALPRMSSIYCGSLCPLCPVYTMHNCVLGV